MRNTEKENACSDKANIRTGSGSNATQASHVPRPYFSKANGGGQDIFAAVKERVSMIETASFYGYPPNRSGFICCPFHGERTPSCRLWDDHFYCFGCHTGGSAIDFTARLFNLSPLEAVKRLNTDFNIGLTLGGHKPTAVELEAARRRQEVRYALERFEIWKQGAIDLVSCAIGVGNDALIHRTPDEWTETEVYAIKQKARLESFVDDLEAGDDGKQLSSLRDWGEVYGIASRICRG